MSVDFTALAASNKVDGNINSGLGSAPYTIAGWILHNETGIDGVVTLNYAAGSTEKAWIRANVGDPFGITVISVNESAANGAATTSSIINLNEWGHVCGVWATSSDRRAFVNGGNKVTDTTSVTEENALDEVMFGSQKTSNYFDGNLAEFGLWTVALTDAEVAALASGICPMFVRPDALVAYYPFFNEPNAGKNWAGPDDLTVHASVATAEHPPRIVYPHTNVDPITPSTFIAYSDWVGDAPLRKLGLIDKKPHP